MTTWPNHRGEKQFLWLGPFGLHLMIGNHMIRRLIIWFLMISPLMVRTLMDGRLITWFLIARTLIIWFPRVGAMPVKDASSRSRGTTPAHVSRRPSCS